MSSSSVFKSRILCPEIVNVDAIVKIVVDSGGALYMCDLCTVCVSFLSKDGIDRFRKAQS